MVLFDGSLLDKIRLLCRMNVEMLDCPTIWVGGAASLAIRPLYNRKALGIVESMIALSHASHNLVANVDLAHYMLISAVAICLLA